MCCRIVRRRCVHQTGSREKVLSVDEVYTEARAEDDYGVAKLDLVYSVNGGAEQRGSAHDGTRAIRDISAGYTFMLEGLKLEPGDVVSYYARATDNNGVSGPQKAATDIYFLRSGRTRTTIASSRAAAAVVVAAAAAGRRRPALAEAARDHRRDVQDGARQRETERKRSTKISRRSGSRSSACASRRASSRTGSSSAASRRRIRIGRRSRRFCPKPRRTWTPRRRH